MPIPLPPGGSPPPNALSQATPVAVPPEGARRAPPAPLDRPASASLIPEPAPTAHTPVRGPRPGPSPAPRCSLDLSKCGCRKCACVGSVCVLNAPDPHDVFQKGGVSRRALRRGLPPRMCGLGRTLRGRIEPMKAGGPPTRGTLCGSPHACRAHSSRKNRREGGKGTNRPRRLTNRRGGSARPSLGAGVAPPGVCRCACSVVCNGRRRTASALCRSSTSGTGGLQVPPTSSGPRVPGRPRPEEPFSVDGPERAQGRPPSGSRARGRGRQL